jgi:hypothetical protein
MKPYLTTQSADTPRSENEQLLALECLRLASAGRDGWASQDVIQAAESFLSFLTTCPADESPALVEAQAQAGERSEAGPSGLGADAERELTSNEVLEQIIKPLAFDLGIHDLTAIRMIRIDDDGNLISRNIAPEDYYDQADPGPSNCSCLDCQARRGELEEDEAIQLHGLSFGQAIEALKEGMAVSRAGWNGKGMFLYYVDAGRYPAKSSVARAHWGNAGVVPYLPYIAMKTADGSVVPWLASQTDVLADDWSIVTVG